MAELISEQYREQQRALHDAGNYGVTAAKYAPKVERLIEANNVSTLLDYGAGSKLSLMRAIADRRKLNRPFRYVPYEPAVKKYADPPDPAEMVTCIDVLEHIEPELLDNVLDDLARVTVGIGFFTVSCVPASKTLPDGRNAHLIQMPAAWWLPKLLQRFELHTFQRQHGGFAVLVTAKE